MILNEMSEPKRSQKNIIIFFKLVSSRIKEEKISKEMNRNCTAKVEDGKEGQQQHIRPASVKSRIDLNISVTLAKRKQ